jgi:hypothetical protein
MLIGKEYRKYANACMELAKSAKSETEREVLSDFARSWLQAAVNAESQTNVNSEQTNVERVKSEL